MTRHPRTILHRSLLLLALAGALAAEEPPQTAAPLSAGQRWNNYARDAVLSPGAFFATVMPALSEHNSNEPEEFGQGWDAFGHRLGRRAARYQLQTAMHHGAAAVFRTQTGYQKCDCAGGFRRFTYAVSRTVVTRTEGGTAIPNAPMIGGVFGAAYISRTWYPASYRSPGETAITGGVQLGIRAGFNVLREFGPELRRFFRRR